VDAQTQLNSALTGRYRIDREIGQGGMATVYLAHDLRHDRAVALKVLNPELGALLGKERFLAEVRVMAKLQHPHLLPLFDSGEADGQLFYVMPHVDGESLRTRITRQRQLPVEEAVRIAVAVGGALDYAHRHGVIHRDLKPENILLHEGQPLVADFGIALAVSVAGSTRITQTGISLGTPQYMSPEQATSDRAIDGRTDIYSLGTVLYEMLAGDPPFTGSNPRAVIAKVITDKPRPLRLARDSVPTQVEAAVDCALAKIPADRFDTAQDFVDALRGTRPVVVQTASTSQSTTIGQPQRAARFGSMTRIAALVAAGIVVGAVAMKLSQPRHTPGPIRFVLAQTDSTAFRNPTNPSFSLARDGSRIVYVGGPATRVQLFVHELNELDPRPITGTEGGYLPVLSPDGRNVLFMAGNRLRQVPIEGGTPVTVSDSGANWSWGDNGVILVYVPPQALYQTSAGGGTARLITKVPPNQQLSTYSFPYLLPGAEAALVTLYKGGGVNMGNAYIGVVRLSDGKITDLALRGVSPRYAAGYILFARQSGTIFAAPFDLGRFRVTGPAVAVQDNVIVRNPGSAEFGVSDNGTLVYRSGVSVKKLVSVDLHGIETPFLPELRDYGAPRFSPDGKRIAVPILGRETSPNTWIYDIKSRVLSRLTDEGGDRPEWSPDGRSVMSLRQDSGLPRFMIQPWDASAEPRTFIQVAGKEVMAVSLPRSGHGYLAARVGAPERDIWIAPVDSPQALRPYLATPAEEMEPSVSPDGKWLAYVSNESGRSEVYVRPMPGPGSRIQISTDGGVEPEWSPKGGELFYRGSGKIILARIANLETVPSVTRQQLFDDVYYGMPVHTTYGASPDGTRLLFTKSGGGESRTIVILNWLDEVRQKVEAARR
jgi:serine/threonine-protein kinase